MGKGELCTGLFELVGYMLTSARGLIDEPQLYGPFRLIDGVSRICDFLAHEETGYGDFFDKLKKRIDKGKFVVISDEEAFVKLLDDLVLDYTRKVKDKGKD